MASIIAPPAIQTSFRAVREGIARIIKQGAAPLARVHDEQKLSFDAQTGQALVDVALITVDDALSAHNGKVHAWMVYVENYDIQRDAQGFTGYVGAGRFNWELDLCVFGFFDNYLGNDTLSAWDVAEEEAELVSAYIAANSPALALDAPQGIKTVKPLIYPQPSSIPAGDGQDVILYPGRMKVVISRYV